MTKLASRRWRGKERGVIMGAKRILTIMIIHEIKGLGKKDREERNRKTMQARTMISMTVEKK